MNKSTPPQSRLIRITGQVFAFTLLAVPALSIWLLFFRYAVAPLLELCGLSAH